MPPKKVYQIYTKNVKKKQYRFQNSLLSTYYHNKKLEKQKENMLEYHQLRLEIQPLFFTLLHLRREQKKENTSLLFS